MIKPVSYLQTDGRWAANDYSTRGEKTNIMESGCGPTAASMVIATWMDKTEDPAKACKWALANGYKATKQGTYYSFFPAYFKRWEIECRQINGQRIDQSSAAYGKVYHQQAFQALQEGHLVIACMGPGLWTRSGHFVLLYAVEGNVAYINDPASTRAERTAGDWARFQREVKYYFIVKRPETTKEDEEMTQEQFNAMMDKWLETQAKKDGSAWSAEDRAWAIKNGIFKGDGNGNMQWQGLLTRESAAVILHRLKG